MKKTFDELYKAFEDRFRGSRQLVKDRLKIYQPLLAQVPRQAEGPTLAVDLGCGRGEWLEILGEAGLVATGVDTNAPMVQEAIEGGRNIVLHDALGYLAGQPGGSVAVITAFHMVEHVPTDYLIELLEECNRVLVDDGLLILETPNPESVTVGAHTFHLDPTHKSPLPPILLEFLVEQAGFAETAILRLNGEPMLEAGPIERSIHLMFEVARDYACLARKRDCGLSRETQTLAAFVGVVSQQMPTDMTKIKEWLRSADTEIARNLSASQATVSQTDQLQQLIADLSAQIDSMQNENAAFRTIIASLSSRLDDLTTDTQLLHQKLSMTVSTLIDRIVTSISSKFNKPPR
ncbi:MAG: methyltransferase domain-containing protein [Mesorhizobium sp.]|uniref:methyltransferase domain-containing protein n=1 Tax=Mesorhizobium sp. TaxID=1871066 RepID=UPI000FE7CAAF|nr:methyltransferase domain-containing protein [Mesorhizobium sp.]RWC92552.1 MAG: methyltransferase domain-containing protein [Mesorhizobium sp.]